MDENNVKHQVEPGVEPGEEPSVESCTEPCGSTISFHNICYRVETKSGCCRSSPKTVLKDVSGICKPGMMNAILGPTGSGKSSLLDVLAGRKDPAGLSGHVLVDGKEQPKNFKCMTGYVVQEDVVMGTLTVTENLMFSANLRLPKTVSTSEKIKRVKDVIFELGLGHCADSKVGTQLIRGISGGERKRTNIGMELIISPSVLFLDEPTTGLDASTAKAVLLLLHRLSRKGRPIIFSIHQPRYSIFKLFDNLTLLAGGMAVYQGPAHQALDYFQSIGYECEAHNNPPDFFLDVINGDSTAVQDSDRIEVSDAVVKLSSNDEEYGGTYSGFKVMTSGSYSKLGAGELDVEIGNVREDLTTKLADIFKNSTCMKELHAEIDPIEKEYKAMLASGSSDVRIVANYNTSFLTQMWYLSKRTLLNNLRNPQTSIFQVIITIIFALLTGTIYLQLDNSLAFGIQNRVGVFFFIVMNQVFSNLSSVDIFINERVIFVHENGSGFYRVSAYFLSKIFCDILPLRLVPTIIFCAITYFMIGLRADVIKFLMFNLNVLLTTIAGSAVVLFGSSSTPIFAVANMICVLFFIVMLIFGGLLINLDSLGLWLQWLKYISVMRYSINFLSINEMAGLEFCAEVITNGTLTEVCDPNAGNAYLEVQGIAYKTNWDLWQNELALVIFTVVVLFLGYVQMRRIQILK